MLRRVSCGAQKKKVTLLGKAKKGDISGPDDSAVKAKAQVRTFISSCETWLLLHVLDQKESERVLACPYP